MFSTSSISKRLLILVALGALTLAACTRTVIVGPDPEVPAESITLEQDNVLVPLNGQVALQAVVAPEDAGTIAWISDDPSIATVSNEGVVNGVSIGETEIFAVAGEFLASCHITVVKAVTGISLNKESITVIRTKSVKIIATITPDDASEPIEWVSENPEIATVDNHGRVSAIAVGKTTITVKAMHVKTECEVEVLPLLAAEVKLDPSAVLENFQVGDAVQFTATVLPEDADDKSVVWSVEEEGVVTVEDGLVTAIAPGIAYIRATAVNGGVYARALVIVAGVRSVPFSEGFEDINALAGWGVWDLDGDGHDWYYYHSSGDGLGHTGDAALLSYSYYYGVLTPDDWVTSPLTKLDENYNRLSFWVSPYTSEYPDETYGAYLVLPDENGELTAEGFNAAIGLVKGTITQGYDILYDTTIPTVVPSSSDGWEQIVVDIPSEYNGKEVFISIRHFDCSDIYAILLDDIEVTNTPEETVTETAPRAPKFFRRDRSNPPSTCLFGSKIVK